MHLFCHFANILKCIKINGRHTITLWDVLFYISNFKNVEYPVIITVIISSVRDYNYKI